MGLLYSASRHPRKERMKCLIGFVCLLSFSPTSCYFLFLFLHCEAFVSLFKETMHDERGVCWRLLGPEEENDKMFLSTWEKT